MPEGRKGFNPSNYVKYTPSLDTSPFPAIIVLELKINKNMGLMGPFPSTISYDISFSKEELEMIKNIISQNKNNNQILLTIISGTLIFVLGQIIQNFILKPIQDFYTVKGEIYHKVIWHSNILTNSGIQEKLIDWASKDMRDLYCQLKTKYMMIPCKKFLSILNIIPNEEDIIRSSGILIRLSNAGGKQGFETKNYDSIDELKNIFKIKI